MFEEQEHYVIGAGPIGRAIALQLSLAGAGRIAVVDRQESALNAARKILSASQASVRFDTIMDIKDVTKRARSIVLAMGWKECGEIVDTLIRALRSAGRNTPVICVGRPDIEDPLIGSLDLNGPAALLGAGLEPGFVESLSSLIAVEFGDLRRLTTHCGGIPARPEPPLNHAIAFGRKLPVEQRTAFARIDGRIVARERFETATAVFVEGIGLLDAYDDAMLRSTAEEAMAHIPELRQRTLRWPGFVEGVRSLHRLGLVSEDLVEMGSSRMAVRDALEILLNRHLSVNAEDQVIVNADVEDTSGQAGQWTAVIRSAPGQLVSAMELATAVPVVAAMEILPQLGLRGPIYPHEPALAEVAMLTLLRLRKHPDARFFERSFGKMRTSKNFGGGNAKTKDTASVQPPGESCAPRLSRGEE
jgi:saccharopine dehydrogenase-like NADP-dependent oxidoreductase